MRSDKKRKIIISLIVISSLAFGLVFSPHQKITKPEICIENNCFDITIADTAKKQEQGLMFVKNMPENSGMLFVFDKQDMYTFWMKNTLIPLDIIRIDQNNTIVDIQTATPCTSTQCQTYGGNKAASYVLEVNRGISEKKGISIGKRVNISY